MCKVYLDSAGTNVFHPRVLDVAKTFTDKVGNPFMSSEESFRVLKGSLIKGRAAVARFLNCDPSEIALMQSTSHSLGSLSLSLPLKKGDNVLVCDLEYQASIVCWQAQMERVGFELREVKTRNGQITAEDFEKYIDENTRVILLAAVQEINGYRADVKKIGELAHRHGCYFIVDGIQEAGALKVDVKELGMDVYCGGGKKWLGNPFGMGFLYINKDSPLPKLKPPYYSYYDIIVSEEFENYIAYIEDPRRHPFDKYTLADNASIFETGGYGNFLGAMGLAEAIRVLEDMGIENVEAHNKELNRYLTEGLKKLGVILQSPDDDAHMSSIVVFNFNGLPNKNVEKERRLQRFLRERGIYVSVRCSTGIGGVRVSFHYYNTREELKLFLDAVKEFMSIDSDN